MIQNLIWLGVYLRITFSNHVFQKLLMLVPLTATGPEVYVTTMTIFLSNFYDNVLETLNHLKSIKLEIYLRVNVMH